MRTDGDGEATHTRPEASNEAAEARGASADGHIAALDGIRAVAVVGVLAFHGLPGVVPGGFLGVSTFFTLSGFLVGGLVFGPDSSAGTGELGRFDARRFLVRRARRLVPAGLGGLVLAVVVSAFTGIGATSLRGGVWSSLGGATNWWLIARAQSYGAGFVDVPIVQPYWSLAIEVQLYVIVALLAVGLSSVRPVHRRAVTLTVLGLAVIGLGLLPSVLSLGVDRTYFGTATRAPEFLIGAVLAVLMAGRGRGTAARRPAAPSTQGVLGAAAFVVTALAFVLVSIDDAWLARGLLPAFGLVSAALVAGALRTGSIVASALSARPLVAIGSVSFGLYVYHWPIFALLSPERTGWSVEALLLPRLAVVGLVAVLSSRYLELPVRRRHRIGTMAWPLPAVVAAAVLALAALPLTDAEPTYGTEIDSVADLSALRATDNSEVVDLGPFVPPETTLPSSARTSSTPVPITAGVDWQPSATGLEPRASRTPSRALRVLLVGDSTAHAVGKVLDAWGRQNGLLSAVPVGAMGCGLLAGGERMHLDRLESNAGDCLGHTDLWEPVIETFAPDVVLVVSGLWDATDHRLEPDDAWRAPGDPIYDAALLGAYQRATQALSESGAIVIWLEAPPILWNPDGSRLDPNAIGANDPGRMEAINLLIGRVAAERPDVGVVPYADFYRAWPGGVFDESIRPDGVHVDEHGAPELAAWLGPEVLATYWDIRDRAG